MPAKDPRVDAYIKKAAPFAQPILRHIRTVVHEACPDVEETIKWSVPAFDYKGPYCGMAAFRAHVRFIFWKVPSPAKGHITSIDDLPPVTTLVRVLKAAAVLNDKGVKKARTPKAAKAPLATPADLKAALAKNKKALATFNGFPPGQRREYVEWVTEAKQAATRARRVATAVEWMAEGKRRNWKYER